MRWILRKEPTRRPPELESAGRAVAEQLRSLYDRVVAERAQQEREQAQTDEWVVGLREGLFRVVRGFNVEVPDEYQVALVDRGDRLVFHAGERKTLTLIYGENSVVIEAKSDYPRLPVPMSLRIWREPGGELLFRAVPDCPVFPKEIMTQAEFLTSVLRMACNQNFDEVADC
jgi:hypothetical protein